MSVAPPADPAPASRSGVLVWRPALPGLGVVVALPFGGSVRVQPRSAAVCTILVVLALLLLMVEVGTGEVPIPLTDVARALVGAADPGTTFIVETLRLPRALAGLLVGIALGVAGAIFQSLTRNPLGSPDLIGFTSGASAGAVAQILVFGGSGLAVSGGALFGGLATGLALYLLAFRGGVEGYRLVLVGIGLSAMLLAVVDYLLTRSSLQDALTAYVWLTGSLSDRDWFQVLALGGALVVLLPLVALGSRVLLQLEVGDDGATALGVAVQRARLATLAAAVAITAFAVATAGPIAFVALAAPQIARRLTRATGPGLLAAGLTGAVLLLAGDVIAQRIAGGGLPVGVVTGVLGGVYLIVLLQSRWKRSEA